MNDDLPPEHDKLLSVSTLNRLARGLLEDAFADVRVAGEISNLSQPASGHWYLTLKDERAQIRCAMFRNRNLRVQLRPANGMQVMVSGRISLYEPRGDYQLILESMQDAGAGALQQAFEALKRKLADEGLFDVARKRPLPARCQHVAVITSPSGAVIRDIITVFRRRFPALRITLLPVPVQGESAVDAIISALATANRRQDLALDAIIVARGGGSLEDLQAFNSEAVARAIATSALPVVSAVGHETDVTIADFVADVRAPTPSAAAELLSPDQQVYLQRLRSLRQRLLRAQALQLQRQQNTLAGLQRRLRHPGQRLQQQAQTLDRVEQQLLRAMAQGLRRHQQHWQQLQQRLLRASPLLPLRQQQQQLKALQQRLRRALQQGLQRQQSHLTQLSRSLDNVSPLRTLQRGYSITRSDSGQVLRDAAALRPGTRIHTRLARGVISSVVNEVILDDTIA